MPDFPIRVVVRTSEANRRIDQTRNRLGQFEARANSAGAALRRAFAFVGGTLAIRQVIGTVANFEQTLSTVQGVTGATERQFARLRAEALRLGTETRFSATQAGEGLLFLSRAGFDVDEAIGALPGTLNLAQAGALDLGRAADIASNVLQGFRLGVDETGRVVDVLALAANSSNTDVEQLGEALKNVAPVAASVGIEIEEAVSAIGNLSNAGIQASSAGIQLRQTIAKLSAPSNKAERALAEIGLTAEDVDIQTIGLAQAFQNLGEAGLDITGAVDIFGLRASSAALVLADAATAADGTQNSISDLARELQRAEGTAAEVARVMDDNLNGALLRVRSAFEGLILNIARGGGFLRDILEDLAIGLRFLADNADATRRVLEGLAFVLGVSLARRAIPAAIRGIQALTIAIATNPFGAILTGITLATGALIAFRDEIIVSADGVTTLSDIAGPAFEEIQNLAMSVAESFGTVADVALDRFPAVGDAIRDVFAPGFVERFVRLLAQSFDTILGLFDGLAAAGSLVFNNLGAAIELSIQSSLNVAIDAVNDFTRLVFQQVNNIRARLEQISRSVPGIAVNFDALIAPQLSRFEISREAQALGGAINEAISQGIRNSSSFSDGVDRIFARGKARALERTEELKNEVSRSLQDLERLTLDFAGGPLPPGLTRPPSAGEDLEALREKNEQQERANKLTDDAGKKLQMTNMGLQTFSSVLGEVATQAANVGARMAEDIGGALQQASDAAADFLVDFVESGFDPDSIDEDNIRNTFAGILRNLGRNLISTGIQGLLGGLLGAPGGGAGGGAGSGLLGLFGGSRARGGAVAAGRAYAVNERGPELFVRSGGALSSFFAAQRATSRTSSSASKFGARQTGGAVIPGGGGPTLFQPTSSGQIIPAAQTAALLNQQSRSETQQIVVQAAPPNVQVTPQVIVDGRVFKDVIRNNDGVRAEIVTAVSNEKDAFRRGGR